MQVVRCNMANEENMIIGAGQDTARPAPNTITHGDARELITLLQSNSVDLIVTDPPYGVGGGIDNNSEHILSAMLPEMYRVLKPDGAIYMFTSFKFLTNWFYRFQIYFKLVNLLVWDKVRHSGLFTGQNYGYSYENIFFGTKGYHKLRLVKNDVFRHKRQNFLQHPMRKPVELFMELIEMSSDVGDVVLDPFVGSGTTAEACIALSREYICFESSAEYYELACSRAEERTSCAQESPALDTVEICHTAPNSASPKAAQVSLELGL